MVVGPILAIGLYEKSRAPRGRRARRPRAHDLRQAALRRADPVHRASCCACLMLLWMRAAVIIYALFFGLRAVSRPRPHRADAVHDAGRLGDAASSAALSAGCSRPSRSRSACSRFPCCSTSASTPSPPWARAWRWSGTICPVMLAWGAIVLALFLRQPRHRLARPDRRVSRCSGMAPGTPIARSRTKRSIDRPRGAARRAETECR